MILNVREVNAVKWSCTTYGHSFGCLRSLAQSLSLCLCDVLWLNSRIWYTIRQQRNYFKWCAVSSACINVSHLDCLRIFCISLSLTLTRSGYVCVCVSLLLFILHRYKCLPLENEKRLWNLSLCKRFLYDFHRVNKLRCSQKLPQLPPSTRN